MNDTKKKGLTTTQIIMIAGFAVIAIAIVVTAVLLLNRKPADSMPMADSIGTPVVNKDNLDDLAAKVAEQVEKGTFMTHMTTVWRFKDGKSPAHIGTVGNAANNRYPFYFIVTLDDTGEQVYKSSLLPVGSVLKEIILEKELAAGEYEATLSYHLIDDETNEEMESNASFAITIIVEE